MLLLIIVLISLATHRLTRLITRDAFPLTAELRNLFVQRWAGFSDAKTKEEKRLSLADGKTTNLLMRSLAYLLECDWCMSVWVAAGLAYMGWRWTELGEHHWFLAVLTALVASTVAGLIAQREPD